MSRQPQSWSSPNDVTPQAWSNVTKDPVVWQKPAAPDPEVWSPVDKQAEAWHLGAGADQYAPVQYGSPIYQYVQANMMYGGLFQSGNISDKAPTAWSDA